MSYKVTTVKKELHFKQPAGTSRGVYTTRVVWYIILTESNSPRYGVGECAPLPALSCDAVDNYEEKLAEVCQVLEQNGHCPEELLIDFPSIRFGLESAFRHLEQGSIKLWDTPFSRGECGITINGLIWMGRFEEMYARIEQKLNEGFHCIKLKIGAIDFDKEIELLANIRKAFSAEQIELRVDANGAFLPEEALEKLNILSHYDIHSIEQPIGAGQWQAMRELCQASPIPIALDEELIGINRQKEKMALLEQIRPQYLVLKPSLHGGLAGTKEWMELADAHQMGYWVTSALESNIGLNAIAQWCATQPLTMPQGLGTGLLFTDNIDFPLSIRHDSLWFDATQEEPDLLKWLGV